MGGEGAGGLNKGGCGWVVCCGRCDGWYRWEEGASEGRGEEVGVRRVGGKGGGCGRSCRGGVGVGVGVGVGMGVCVNRGGGGVGGGGRVRVVG